MESKVISQKSLAEAAAVAGQESNPMGIAATEASGYSVTDYISRYYSLNSPPESESSAEAKPAAGADTLAQEPVIENEVSKPAETEPATEVTPVKVRPEKAALTGLGEFINRAKQWPAAASSWASAEVISRASTLSEKLASPEKKNIRRKTVLAALGLVAVAGAAYAASKYGHNIHIKSSHHEALQPTVPAKAPAHHPAEILQGHNHVSAPAIEHHPRNTRAAHHAKAAAENVRKFKNSVTVRAGDGYTQVLQRLFPGHSAQQYYDAYKEEIKLHGPGFLKGVGHYRQGGDWSLSGTGRAHLSGAAARSLTKLFGSR